MTNNVLIEFGLRVVLLILVTFIMPMLIKWVEANKDNKQVAIIRSLAEIAVRATEQMWGVSNAEKKAIATKKLKALLLSKNISISDALIDDYVEFAVNLLPDTR